MKIKILLFHRVNPTRDNLWDPISPKRFAEILAFCKKQFYIVPLEEYILNSQVNSVNKKEVCAVCFDDGYKDFIEYAMPILHKHQTPASMYIVTDCANTGLPPWTYIIDFLFQHTSKKNNAPTPLLPATFKTDQWATSAERVNYAQRLKPFMKSLQNNERVELLNHYIRHFSDIAIPRNLMMTWDEIRAASKDGICIGSHSHTHPMLGRLEDEAKVEYELKESFKELKLNLGSAPIAISYPIGSYNETVKKISAKVGYKIGLAVNQKLYDSEKNDYFEIPRIELYNESLLKSRLRINGSISLVNSILKR